MESALSAFADVLLEGGHGGFKLDEVGACLSDGSFVGHAGLFHELHGSDAFFPDFDGFLRGSELFVEHLKRVVHVCDACDDAGACSLFVGFAQFEIGFRLFLGVANFAEACDLPRCIDGETVGLGGFTEVPAGDGSLRIEGEGGVVGESCHLQCCLALLHGEFSALQVEVVVQCFLDEGLQFCIGEDLLPGCVAEVGGVGFDDLILAGGVAIEAVNSFGQRVRSLVVAVLLTCGEADGADRYEKKKLLH